MKPNPETKVCTHCGQVFPLSSLTAFNGELLCPDCLAHEITTCFWRGNRIWRDDNYGTDDTPLCRNCYDDHYTSCPNCGKLIRQHDAFYIGDDEPYCLHCFRHHNDRSIHGMSLCERKKRHSKAAKSCGAQSTAENRPDGFRSYAFAFARRWFPLRLVKY